jgi:hypothetical protein
MEQIQVTIENGCLVIKLPLAKNPQPSASGKTVLVASTHGSIRTMVTVQDKPVTVSVNAYIAR